jgi:TonB-dependent starch-binding outer membrane protein SusC
MKKILSFIIILLFSIPCFCQIKIQGMVIDGVTKKPLKDASIVLNNAEKIIKIKKNGKFSFEAKSLDSVSFLAPNYSSAATTIGTSKFFKVELFPIEVKAEKTDIGYGAMDKKQMTSAVTVVEEKDFNKVIATDIYQYLRGKVPGLTIKSDSGNPTNEPTITLRGGGSFSNISPMIVIDGAQNASLGGLDPNDVANVTVLRDGSAQAIYGSQASSGVIIIKTKKAKK